MIVLISPAKTIDLTLNFNTQVFTEPVFVEETSRLVRRLKKLSVKKLGEIMKINAKLSKLNADRYKGWDLPETIEKQAVAIFKGEVYNGLKAWELSEDTLLYAQDHLRILSGLYGILRPLDRIKPYRLEMGTQLSSKSLYAFWGKKISLELKTAFSNENTVLINLASNEYFKSIQPTVLKQRIVSPVFKDLKNGEYKVITVYSKKARGLMTRFILENKIEDPEELISFNSDGYYFNESMSTPDMPVFTRDRF